MEKTDKIYLEDIFSSVELILNDYVEGLDFEGFDKDKKTQDAVIRQIAIIGEAMGKLNKDLLTNHPELPSREAVAMRNVLVHDYDFVDTMEVWKTIEKDLPVLKEIIKKILDDEF